MYSHFRTCLEKLYYILLCLLLRRSPSLEPHLLFAFAAPKAGGFASGGRVKLFHLAAHYPENFFRGNILYLVTSCLPFAALSWARACKKKGIKIVINQNGVAYPAWTSESETKRMNLRNKQLLELADYVLYQSKFCREAVEKWVGSYCGPSAIVYNCVDTEKFSPKQDTFNHAELRIIAIGSHHQAERVLHALDFIRLALDSKISCHLTIAGILAWPNAQSDVGRHISALNLKNNVRLYGPYLQEEAPALYQNADILLHLKDKDPSPTVPVEAMACGVLVVATESGGLPELILPDGGILVPVRQDWEKIYFPKAPEIFYAIQKLLPISVEKREKSRWQACQRFSKHGWLQRHEEIFLQVLRS